MTDFTYTGATWSDTLISWWIDIPSWELHDSFVFQVVAEAFALWDNMVELDFVHSAFNYDALTRDLFDPSEPADIAIRFGAVDGPGGSLSTLDVTTNFFTDGSVYKVNVVIDESESWTWSPTLDTYVIGSGITAFELVLHEIGHALGLGHSDNPDALMYSDLTGSATSITNADVLAAQALYGEETDWGWAYLNGWYKQPDWAWAVDWQYGAHQDWSWGWIADEKTGWHIDWSWGPTLGWVYGWHLDWGVGWSWDASAGAWEGRLAWLSGWGWTWDWFWNASAGGWDWGGTWMWDLGWTLAEGVGWSWEWDWGHYIDWYMGWVLVDDYGWSWSWVKEETGGWSWAYGWYTEYVGEEALS